MRFHSVRCWVDLYPGWETWNSGPYIQTGQPARPPAPGAKRYTFLLELPAVDEAEEIMVQRPELEESSGSAPVGRGEPPQEA